MNLPKIRAKYSIIWWGATSPKYCQWNTYSYYMNIKEKHEKIIFFSIFDLTIIFCLLLKNLLANLRYITATHKLDYFINLEKFPSKNMIFDLPNMLEMLLNALFWR